MHVSYVWKVVFNYVITSLISLFNMYCLIVQYHARSVFYHVHNKLQCFIQCYIVFNEYSYYLFSCMTERNSVKSLFLFNVILYYFEIVQLMFCKCFILVYY